jgi:dCMP deaminase
MTRIENWNEYFMTMARLVARKSKDQSVQVGVVIVGPDHEVRSTGYNGFCRGIDESDPARWERPSEENPDGPKYLFVEHAERNAIYNAARIGVSTRDCIAYMESPPCTDCGRALIQAGIKEVVVTTQNPFRDRKDWKKSIQFAMDMLEESGVKVTWTDL